MLTKELKQVYKRTDPKKGVKINVTEKNKGTISMESWSILSDHVKYVQHDESDNLHIVNVDSLNYHVDVDIYKDLKEQEMLKANKDFSGVSEKVKSDYLDVYCAVYAEVISTNRFDEDTDLSTAYLGQTDMSRKAKVKS